MRLRVRLAVTVRAPVPEFATRAVGAFRIAGDRLLEHAAHQSLVDGGYVELADFRVDVMPQGGAPLAAVPGRAPLGLMPLDVFLGSLLEGAHLGGGRSAGGAFDPPLLQRIIPSASSLETARLRSRASSSVKVRALPSPSQCGLWFSS